MVHAFLVANQTILRSTSFVLGAIALVFGGQVLGRFQSLKQKGGLYSRLLVAIPATAFFAAIFFFEDERIGFFYTHTYGSALALALTPVTVAVVYGLLLGFVPALTNPNTFRVQSKDMSGLEQTTALIGNFVSLLVLYYLGFIIDAQIVCYKLNMCHGFQPTNTQLIIATVVAAVSIYVAGFSWGVIQALDEDSSGLLKAIAGILGSSGCLVSLATVVPGVIVFIYLIRIMGWSLLAFAGLAIVGYVLLIIIQRIAENLSAKQLGVIFSIPGALAAVLYFTLNNLSSINF